MERLWIIALAVIIILGLAVRVALAPFSAGSDLAQFIGFSDSFVRHGFCFYNYADASKWEEEGWPYNWAYVYGPMWIYVLGVLRTYIRSDVKIIVKGDTRDIYIPVDWIVAVKSVLIVVDTAVALILFMIISRQKDVKTGVIAAALYYLNPMTIYISSIFGMFDPLTILFFLAGLAVLDRDKILSGILIASSILTKQIMLLPMIMILVYLFITRTGLLRFIIGVALGTALILMPIALACPSSLTAVYRLMFGFYKPSYTYPLCYGFNGLSSLASYLHSRYEMDTLWLIEHWWVPAIILAFLVILFIYEARRPWEAAALGYTVFTATYWRVNHQYLVPLIALLILILLIGKEEMLAKLLALTIMATAGFWVIAFPSSWWFHVHIETPNWDLVRLIDNITLMIFDDEFYVGYALMLTFQQYLLIALWTGKHVFRFMHRIARRLFRGK